MLCSDITCNICGTNRECLWKTSSYSHYMRRGGRGVWRAALTCCVGAGLVTSSLSPKPQHIYGILLVNHFLYFFALTVHDYLMQVEHVANTSEWTGFHFVLSVRVINDVVYASAQQVKRAAARYMHRLRMCGWLYSPKEINIWNENSQIILGYD